MNNKHIFYIVSVFFLTIITIFPLFHAGFFAFHDNTQVVRVLEMEKSLSSGMFPVRWVSDLGYGYGYPIFNFYGPLPYYLGGTFILAGFNSLVATKIMFAIGIVLSGISMFLFSRRFFGNPAGVISAIVYSYFPYHAVNIYVRGAVGEFYAYAFLPLLFLGLYDLFNRNKDRLDSSKNLSNILLISLLFFLVAISHNLSIFMVVLLLIPFVMISGALARRKVKFFINLFAAILLGAALSAFYILPAVSEMKYANVASQIGGGADFRNHFVCLSQYWNSMWGYGGSTGGCIDGLSFKLGKTNIIFLVFSLIIFGYSIYRKKFRESEKVFVVSILLLAASFFLTLKPSEFIWQSFSYMSYIQYPWRFINFVGLFMSFLVGYLLCGIEENFSRKIWILSFVGIIALTIVTNYKLFVPQEYNSLSSDYYANEDYVKFTVSKISDEYMPPSFSTPKEISDLPKFEAELLNSTGNVGILESRTGYLRVSYDMQQDGVLHVSRAYFPAWRAYSNNKEVSIVPTHNGMNISLPQGKGLFELKFKQTYIEIIGNIISIIAFIIVLIGIIIHRLKSN